MLQISHCFQLHFSQAVLFLCVPADQIPSNCPPESVGSFCVTTVLVKKGLSFSIQRRKLPIENGISAHSSGQNSMVHFSRVLNPLGRNSEQNLQMISSLLGWQKLTETICSWTHEGERLSSLKARRPPLLNLGFNSKYKKGDRIMSVLLEKLVSERSCF